MQIYLCVVCATIHACSNTCVAWLFPSRVNLHVTSHVNIDFHGKFWHSAHEKRCAATHRMYRVCEVVVELYRTYSKHQCNNYVYKCKQAMYVCMAI